MQRFQSLIFMLEIYVKNQNQLLSRFYESIHEAIQ